jgi:hypothetical protein
VNKREFKQSSTNSFKKNKCFKMKKSRMRSFENIKRTLKNKCKRSKDKEITKELRTSTPIIT